MTLASGTRLGPYEIRGALGAGGMGEVYRASDTKLKREVAIKVLPDAFARDETRMKRFEREAQLLASLNHPNLAAVYGVEEGYGIWALVMELIEGPSLAERIATGPIPIDESLRIALQIAQGLEAAHEKAVIHRDLKPANVKLTADGDVKILDFGLAKALEAEAPPSEESHSPTLTRATEVGVLLGTAAYMSPEQAKGKPADRRADVWAFGVVLYEMLTGKRAFAGEDVSETLAHVLTKEPSWSALPGALPARVRALLARCLTKDPKKRLQAIGEARISIEEAIAGVTEANVVPTRAVSPLWLAVAGAATLALGVTVGALWPRSAPSAAPAVRLSAELGMDLSRRQSLMRGPAAVLSPDGTLAAFVARGDTPDEQQLYLRRLDQLEASPLAGTEGARNPFFSPDGQWVAFFAEGKLKKVAIAGGAAVTLCEAPDDRGGSWGEDGTIVFTPSPAADVFLSRVSSSGGTPEVLTKPDPAEGDVTHRWPQVLPGGRGVLYTASTIVGKYDGATIVAEVLPNGPKKLLVRGGYHGRYLPSGHLVYVREGTLFAAAFDLDRMELSGQPVPAVEGVTSSSLSAGAQFAFSDRGTLAYLPGATMRSEFSIDWLDRAGKTEPLRSVPGDYFNLRFSPDGRTLAIEIRESNNRDVWLYEWERDNLSRLTFDAGEDTRAIWTPDGTRIAFASTRADKKTPNLYWQRADGTGEAERLNVSNAIQSPESWHPSGKFLAFNEVSLQTGTQDIMILPMEGNEASGWEPGKPTAFLNAPFHESQPEFSPDGRWLAYQSDETGRNEIYVRPFPGPGGKWQVSTEGGINPAWSRTRLELFYATEERRILVVPYAIEGGSFRGEKPRLWSEGPFAVGPAARSLDLHPEGERFAVLTNSQADISQNRVVFILNFFDELRRIAPPSPR
jgi:serine/threonine-protein kinase